MNIIDNVNIHDNFKLTKKGEQAFKQWQHTCYEGHNCREAFMRQLRVSKVTFEDLCDYALEQEEKRIEQELEEKRKARKTIML